MNSHVAKMKPAPLPSIQQSPYLTAASSQIGHIGHILPPPRLQIPLPALVLRKCRRGDYLLCAKTPYIGDNGLRKSVVTLTFNNWHIGPPSYFANLPSFYRCSRARISFQEMQVQSALIDASSYFNSWLHFAKQEIELWHLSHLEF